MRTLIYKRTHHGDPDMGGRFGIHDCMGRVRRWDFDAVIGVGGMGPEARSHGLDGKVNWIGIGPQKHAVPGYRGPIVTFDHFVLYGSDGPYFERLAPVLSERIYSKNVRVLMNGLSPIEQKEVDSILRRAKNARSSSGRGTGASLRRACAPRRAPKLPKPAVKGCS